MARKADRPAHLQTLAAIGQMNDALIQQSKANQSKAKQSKDENVSTAVGNEQAFKAVPVLHRG